MSDSKIKKTMKLRNKMVSLEKKINSIDKLLEKTDKKKIALRAQAHKIMENMRKINISNYKKVYSHL